MKVFCCNFATVNENRSSSKCLGTMKFLLTSPSAFVPRSLKNLNYEYNFYSAGKRGVA
jgi:hypothetical protein